MRGGGGGYFGNGERVGEGAIWVRVRAESVLLPEYRLIGCGFFGYNRKGEYLLSKSVFIMVQKLKNYHKSGILI